MLQILHIENIAVIEQAEISFDRGFNVLTGETGAGKSIVIDAISAILGERTSRDLIRTGAPNAFVSAIFTDVPPSAWFERNRVEYAPDELSIQREILADGRNTCRVNGRPVTVSQLRALGAELVNIHGQNDSQQLFDEATHLSCLDLYAADGALLAQYQELFRQMSVLSSEIARLSMDEAEKQRLVETLRWQIDEIERAALEPDEEDTLTERRKTLQNAEKLTDAIDAAVDALYGGDSSNGAAALLSDAAHALSRAGRYSDEMQSLSQRLTDLMYQTQDAAEELRAQKDALEYSGEELEQIEQRLDTIFKLKRKYGRTVPDILAFLAGAKSRLEDVEFASDRIAQLEKKRAALQTELERAGLALRDARMEAGRQLEDAVCAELSQLDMPKIRFVCEFSEQEPQESGMDAVRFLMSANVGESLRPMAKVASGGELARIMLAIKNVLAQKDAVGTMIFDEVDAGVSGRAAEKVAYKLWTVSRGRQVLCITHLPQLAAMADTEYIVEKRVENGRTYTSVRRLSDPQRRMEIARLTGGSVLSDTILAGADELLRAARQQRESGG